MHGIDGIKTLSPKAMCEKFSRKKSWLWLRLKNDPEFPRPIYLGPGAPVWMAHEVDQYLALLAERSRKSGVWK